MKTTSSKVILILALFIIALSYLLDSTNKQVKNYSQVILHLQAMCDGAATYGYDAGAGNFETKEQVQERINQIVRTYLNSQIHP